MLKIVTQTNMCMTKYTARICDENMSRKTLKGQDPIRSKIIINKKCLEQVPHYNYLGCDVSYEDEKYINKKIRYHGFPRTRYNKKPNYN